VSVLKALKGSDIYEVDHLLPTRGGFHELDLRAFTEKLVDLAPDHKRSSIEGKETVTLQSVLCGRRDSLEVKLNLVRAILSGNIAVLSNSDGTVGSLVIDRAAFQRLVADARSSAAGNTKKPSEVSRILSCGSDAIRGLVALGALQARVTPAGLRVSDESIAEFNHEYASLCSIAKAKQTSSRALMRRCGDRDISTLLVPMPRRGPQPFVRRTDHARLACA
jgi:hypothetical protein